MFIWLVVLGVCTVVLKPLLLVLPSVPSRRIFGSRLIAYVYVDSVSLWKSDSSLVPRPRRYVRAPPAPTSTHFDAALRSGPMLTENCADIKLRKEPASLKRLVVPW